MAYIKPWQAFTLSKEIQFKPIHKPLYISPSLAKPAPMDSTAEMRAGRELEARLPLVGEGNQQSLTKEDKLAASTLKSLAEASFALEHLAQTGEKNRVGKHLLNSSGKELINPRFLYGGNCSLITIENRGMKIDSNQQYSIVGPLRMGHLELTLHSRVRPGFGIEHNACIVFSAQASTVDAIQDVLVRSV